MIITRDILNRNIRGESLYDMYKYVHRIGTISENELLEKLSIPPEKTDLNQNALGYLQNIGILSEGPKIQILEDVNDETDFKIKILEKLHTHPALQVNYVRETIRELYKLDTSFTNNTALPILQQVRRENELSDETQTDRVKFNYLMSMSVYLGLLGTFNDGRTVYYIPCLDPSIMVRVLQAWDEPDVQIARFLDKTDRENFPSLNDASEPYTAIEKSFVAAEYMNLISLSNPADFGLGYRVGSTTVSRVKVN